MKNENKVFLGTGCGEPQHLIRTQEKGYREVSMTLLEDKKTVLHIVKDLFPGIKFERGSGGILKARATLEGRLVDGC